VMKFKFYDQAGATQEVSVEDAQAVAWYKEAADQGMSVPALLATRYPTNQEQYGSTFEQFCAGLGLFVRADKANGIRPPTIAEAMNGSAALQAGTVVKDAAPASRALFPAVIVQAIENKLKHDYSTDANIFEQLVAVDLSVAGERYDQPVLNFSRPEAARHAGISQLSLPNSMLSITVSDVSRKIPTISLGMEISDQAAKITSLDLVTLALARQAEVERAARVSDYLGQIVAGDLDVGSSALTLNPMVATYDTGATAGTLTHKAWVKFIRRSWKDRHINWVLSDLDTLFKIENRTGKPVVANVLANGSQISPTFDVVNPQWQNVKHFLLDDASAGGPLAADRVLGLDSRYGIVRARNIQAEYQAVEEFVLRRAKAMRFDFGEMCYRLFDAAFEYMNVGA
jgi:hypothetical protein